MIAGERRLEASKSIGLEEVAAIVQDVDDEARLELGLIENIQREDLNPIEEARAYDLLMERFDLTQEEVSEKLGRKRTTITNTLRLLSLPEDIQVEIATGSISPGHAKALMAIDDEGVLREAIQKLREGSYTVRQTEELVRELDGRKGRRGKRRGRRVKKTLDPHLQEIVDFLQNVLGTKVRLVPKSGSGGQVQIEYFDHDDLNRILDVFGFEMN